MVTAKEAREAILKYKEAIIELAASTLDRELEDIDSRIAEEVTKNNWAYVFDSSMEIGGLDEEDVNKVLDRCPGIAFLRDMGYKVSQTIEMVPIGSFLESYGYKRQSYVKVSWR